MYVRNCYFPDFLLTKALPASVTSHYSCYYIILAAKKVQDKPKYTLYIFVL